MEGIATEDLELFDDIFSCLLITDCKDYRLLFDVKLKTNLSVLFLPQTNFQISFYYRVMH